MLLYIFIFIGGRGWEKSAGREGEDLVSSGFAMNEANMQNSIGLDERNRLTKVGQPALPHF